MATLHDVPVILRRVGLWRFTGRVWHEIMDDSLFTWAAALAYSWLFAIFPFLIFVLWLLPYLPDTYRNGAVDEIQHVLLTLPEPAYRAIWPNVADAVNRPRQGLLGMGLLVTIWAASGGMAATMTALDRCYEIEKSRSFAVQRLAAIVLTIAVATLALGIMLVLPLGRILTRRLVAEAAITPFAGAMINICRWFLGLVLMLVVVMVVYQFGIRIRQRFRLLTPGGVFTVLVWIMLGVAFRLYLHRAASAYNRTYGTVGGVAILLFLFYVDALVLLIGAEINSEIDYEVLNVPRGSRDFRKALPAPAKLGSSLGL